MDIELDVRTIALAHRHDTIFARLETLETGQALVITNDHNPAPLSYQLQALYPDKYGWEYLERGPECWRVEIRRQSE